MLYNKNLNKVAYEARQNSIFGYDPEDREDFFVRAENLYGQIAHTMMEIGDDFICRDYQIGGEYNIPEEDHNSYSEEWELWKASPFYAEYGLAIYADSMAAWLAKLCGGRVEEIVSILSTSISMPDRYAEYLEELAGAVLNFLDKNEETLKAASPEKVEWIRDW